MVFVLVYGIQHSESLRLLQTGLLKEQNTSFQIFKALLEEHIVICKCNLDQDFQEDLPP